MALRSYLSLSPLAFLALAGTACATTTPVPTPVTALDAKSGLKAILSQGTAVNGSVMLVTVENVSEASAKPLMARFGDAEFPLFEVSDGGVKKFEGLFGVNYYQTPGKFDVDVFEAGKPDEILVRVPVEIKDGGYKSETLSVSGDKVKLSPKNLKRVAREQREVGAIYATPTMKRLWTRPLLKPIESEFTSHYGNKRVFNGELKSYHSGLDFRAKVGTPIRAATGGIIRLVSEHFMPGGIIIVDHGLGFFTAYLHMSRFDVKKGQMVKPGEILGLSGASGRVSGPHLHWTVTLNKVKADPLHALEVLK